MKFSSSAGIREPVDSNKRGLSAKRQVHCRSASASFVKIEPECMNHQTRQLLKNLNTAEAVLRQNLHMHCLDETARHHMERAATHVREAYIAVNEPGCARSVSALLADMAAGERIIAYATAKASNQLTHENH